jgi:4-hydroxybenzoate polyprenyltransferase
VIGSSPPFDLRASLSLVAFSHSVFALPFALASAWVAARGRPELSTLAWIVVCAVAARTAAMGFNRLVDRRFDAANPRTAGRELPRGALSPVQVRWLVAGSAGLFLWGAWQLNPLAGRLAPAVLVLLGAYSYCKRFTWAGHLVLGLCLALAPLGAWIGVRGAFDGPLAPPLWLAAAVATWVFGFDLIYACQDAEFDRRAGLHSIPARFGLRAALRLSSALHVGTVALLAAFAASARLGLAFATALAGAAALLWWQHRLVAPDDLSRVDRAFFTLNGWVGVVLFAGVVLDLHFGPLFEGRR